MNLMKMMMMMMVVVMMMMMVVVMMMMTDVNEISYIHSLTHSFLPAGVCFRTGTQMLEAFCTETLFCTHTQTPLDTEVCKTRIVYTQKLLHRATFTQRNRYTEQLLHTNVFTRRYT